SAGAAAALAERRAAAAIASSTAADAARSGTSVAAHDSRAARSCAQRCAAEVAANDSGSPANYSATGARVAEHAGRGGESATERSDLHSGQEGGSWLAAGRLEPPPCGRGPGAAGRVRWKRREPHEPPRRANLPRLGVPLSQATSRDIGKIGANRKGPAVSTRF